MSVSYFFHVPTCIFGVPQSDFDRFSQNPGSARSQASIQDVRHRTKRTSFVAHLPHTAKMVVHSSPGVNTPGALLLANTSIIRSTFFTKTKMRDAPWPHSKCPLLQFTGVNTPGPSWQVVMSVGNKATGMYDAGRGCADRAYIRCGYDNRFVYLGGSNSRLASW